CWRDDVTETCVLAESAIIHRLRGIWAGVFNFPDDTCGNLGERATVVMDGTPAERGQAEGMARVGLYLLLGRLMFQNGASAPRIVDTLLRLKDFLGDEAVNVMLTYEAIGITREADGEVLTKIGRRRQGIVVNIGTLSQIEEIIDRLPGSGLTVTEIRRRLEEIAAGEKPLTTPVTVACFAVAAAGFAVLNNADWWATGAVTVAALVIGWLRHFLAAHRVFTHLALLLAAFIGTLLVGLVIDFVPTRTPLVGMVAALLPLVPGAAIITGGVELFCNYNSVGVGRWSYAAVVIALLVTSLVVPMLAFPREFQDMAVVAPSGTVLLINYGLASGLAALALAILMRAPRRLWLWFFFGGLLAREIRTAAMLAGLSLSLSTFAGAALVAVAALPVARRHRLPATILAMVCVLPMIPGYFIINGIDNITAFISGPTRSLPYGFWVETLHYILQAGGIITGLMAGILLPVMTLSRSWRRL
ncbi:MAG: threonine/serine exporter family protein, partial [Negativicutes bacterium]|nr:threonine/serine exporter family protein [Negativicutes bacterium]